MNDNFSVCGEYVFRGIEYQVSFSTVNKPTQCLAVEVEDKVTGDQWKGAFDASCMLWFTILFMQDMSSFSNLYIFEIIKLFLSLITR